MEPEQPSENPQHILDALLSSGFPFQTAVASVVSKVERWSLLDEEFPWQDGTVDQFLDIVVWNQAIIVSIECNKTQKEVLTFVRVHPAG